MADLIGHVVLFKADEGGRRNPAYSGFTPVARMQGGSCAMACHFMSEDCLNPGESDAASITLTMPELCNRINSGETFDLEEAGRVIGRLTVLENLWKERNRYKKATLTSMTPLLCVSNIRASLDFYSKLGFEKIAEHSAPQAGAISTLADWISIRRNDVVIMLQQTDHANPATARNAGGLYITTDDVTTLHRSFHEAGLTTTDLADKPGGGKEFSLTDPNGWKLSFSQSD